MSSGLPNSNSKLLADDIQRRTFLKPFNLLFIVRMVYAYAVWSAIGMVEHQCKRLAGGKFGKTHNVNAVIFLNFVIIGEALYFYLKYTL